MFSLKTSVLTHLVVFHILSLPHVHALVLKIFFDVHLIAHINVFEVQRLLHFDVNVLRCIFCFGTYFPSKHTLFSASIRRLLNLLIHSTCSFILTRAHCMMEKYGSPLCLISCGSIQIRCYSIYSKNKERLRALFIFAQAKASML